MIDRAIFFENIINVEKSGLIPKSITLFWVIERNFCMSKAIGYSPWRNGKALFVKQFLRWKRSTFILVFMVGLPIVALTMLKALDVMIQDAIDRSGFFGEATQSPATNPISLRTSAAYQDRWQIIDSKYQGPRFAMCDVGGTDFGNKDVLAKTADGIWTSLYPISSTHPMTPVGYTLPEVTTFADRAALAKNIRDTWDTQYTEVNPMVGEYAPYGVPAYLVPETYSNTAGGVTMTLGAAVNSTSASYRMISKATSLFKNALANSVAGTSKKIESNYKDFPQDTVSGINVVNMVAGYFFTPILHFFSVYPFLHLTQFPSQLLLSFSRRSTSSA